MRTTTISISIPDCTPDALTTEQYMQLINVAEKMQSYLPFETVTLIDFIYSAIDCFSNSYCKEDYFREKIEIFKQKYYPYGIKPNKRSLTEYQYNILEKWRRPRYKYVLPAGSYKAIEKVAFLKTLRAYRDCFNDGMTKYAVDELVEKLKEVRIMIRNID